MISRPLWSLDFQRETRSGGRTSGTRLEQACNEWPESKMETRKEGLDRRRCSSPRWPHLWRLPSGEPGGETSDGGRETKGICRLFGDQRGGQGSPLGRHSRAL